MKVDISALLGGDVYSLLRERTAKAQSRFSKERDADKALAERQKCLTKLAALSADIPPEVLASLRRRSHDLFRDCCPQRQSQQHCRQGRPHIAAAAAADLATRLCALFLVVLLHMVLLQADRRAVVRVAVVLKL
jgi:hypothetical protein